MKTIIALVTLTCTLSIQAAEHDISWKGVVPPMPSVLNSHQNFNSENIDTVSLESTLVTRVVKTADEIKMVVISAKL